MGKEKCKNCKYYIDGWGYCSLAKVRVDAYDICVLIKALYPMAK